MKGAIDETKHLIVYVMVLGVFLFGLTQKVDSLKTEINTTIRVQCLAGQSTAAIAKYNDLVQALRIQQLTAEQINKKNGATAKAAADAKFAERYLADLIEIPKQGCSKPFLK